MPIFFDISYRNIRLSIYRNIESKYRPFDICGNIELSIYRIYRKWFAPPHPLAPPVFFHADTERKASRCIKCRNRTCVPITRNFFLCLSASYRIFRRSISPNTNGGTYARRAVKTTEAYESSNMLFEGMIIDDQLTYWRK